jgi:radical SAM superfamily enzyme YgiQ (UPF0313 family)
LLLPPNANAIEPFRSQPNKPEAVLLGFPMGLGYIAAALRATGRYEVRLVDAVKRDLSLDEVCRLIREFDPHYIGMTLYTRMVKVAVALAGRIKRDFPGKTVIGGGPHASDDYANLLARYPVFDFLVVGEGEDTLPELLAKLDADPAADVSGVPGLAYRARDGGDRVVFTGERALPRDIDRLPPPARDLVDFDAYILKENLLPHAAEIMTSRGCSHRCVFCSFQRKWRPRAPAAIVAEMKDLIARYPQIRSFLLFDDNFSVSRKRVVDLCQALIAAGLNRYLWSCLCRADQVDAEMLRWMRKAGCTKIMFGVESGCPEILAALDKRIDLDQVREACRLTSRAGIDTCAFFIIGSPGETPETVERSYRFAKRLACKSTQWGIMQVYPGTQLAELQPCADFVSYLYEPEVAEPGPGGLSANVPVFENPGLDREALKALYMRLVPPLRLWKVLQHPLFTVKKILRDPSLASAWRGYLLSAWRAARGKR